MAASGNYQRKMEAGYTIDLNSQAANWATPNAGDGAKATAGTKPRQQKSLPSDAEHIFRFSPPAPAIPNGPPSSETSRTSRRRLNPAFVAILMGLPWWWTRSEWINSAASEMELYRFRLRQCLSNFGTA